jgi:hypothetical protein
VCRVGAPRARRTHIEVAVKVLALKGGLTGLIKRSDS